MPRFSFPVLLLACAHPSSSEVLVDLAEVHADELFRGIQSGVEADIGPLGALESGSTHDGTMALPEEAGKVWDVDGDGHFGLRFSRPLAGFGAEFGQTSGSLVLTFLSGGAKYSLMKNLVLQLSASQSIGRPDYNNLAGALSIDETRRGQAALPGGITTPGAHTEPKPSPQQVSPGTKPAP